jgi:hypothetical protein
MTEKILQILWSARMDAVCDRWHLTERAIPPLKALAGNKGDDRLQQATEQAIAASEHFEAAVVALRSAVGLLEPFVPQSS